MYYLEIEYMFFNSLEIVHTCTSPYKKNYEVKNDMKL